MSAPRLYVPLPLVPGQSLDLPEGAARHVQVLRLQPGAPLMLFNGEGGEHEATVEQMGRKDVSVQVGQHRAAERELAVPVTLALGMPANDRMDTLVEKATELGVAAIQPLVCERSVLRLSGERAQRRCEHWQGIAVAVCEQSGRTRVPRIHPVCALPMWLAGLGLQADQRRWLLSLSPDAQPVHSQAAALGQVLVLSGPEGGLSASEEAIAAEAGFSRMALGPRVLRADTAPLAVLSWLALSCIGAG